MADNSKKPYGNVTYADPGYQSDGKARYPIDSEEHVRAAWSYINQSDNAGKYSSSQLSAIKGRIRAAAKKYGIQIEDSGSRSEDFMYTPTRIHRYVPLEDISIKPGSGRVVEAYLAVFNTDAEIRDGQGHYMERIAPHAFNKAVNDARPAGSRAGWKTSVYYNHALTPYGTPSERWSTPIAVTQELHVESRGVRCVDMFLNTPDGDHVLELVRAGAVKGYSFTGRMIKSDPNRPPARGYRANSLGVLPSVTRHELGLDEYGPTPEPAYETAGILTMRSNFMRTLLTQGMTPEEALEWVQRMDVSTPDGDPEPDNISDTSGEEVVTDESQQHSVRRAPRRSAEDVATILRQKGILG